MHGDSGQFVYNRWAGVPADLGAVYDGRAGRRGADTTMTNYLFRPHLCWRRDRSNPYIQALWGGVFAATSVRLRVLATDDIRKPPAPTDAGESPVIPADATHSAFALTAESGLNIQVRKRIGMRPIPVDYFVTRLTRQEAEGRNSRNNLRYSAGGNFTIGSR